MKIAMVASPHVAVPPQKYGGTERVIYYLIKGLQERGHEVVLLAPGDSRVDCEVIPICEKGILFGMTDAEHLEVAKEVEKIGKYTRQLLHGLKNKVDIIHSHGFDLINFADFPNITTLHGMFTLEKMEYYQYRQDLYYLTISANQQEPFPNLKYAGIAYNGLDPQEFPIVITPKEYVCFLGRFDREKNPHLAIELALHWGLPIKIAGKIDFQGSNYFKRRVARYLDNPLVEYLGEIGMQEKIDLLSNAKINLHPTGFREPFGLTVLEAAYCGTPTVAIKRGSMQELIEEGRTGILVEDFEEAYHRLDEVVAMDRQYVASRSRMLFNYQNMAKQYEEAYQKVIADFKPVVAKRVKPLLKLDPRMDRASTIVKDNQGLLFR